MHGANDRARTRGAFTLGRNVEAAPQGLAQASVMAR